MEHNSTAVLYTFVRCPYAIRARFALALCDQRYQHREVDLRNKPDALLRVSPKGTVPVLVLPNGRVIDESQDIIVWAFLQKTPQQFLPWDATQALSGLTSEFFRALNISKYADRHTDGDVQRARNLCMSRLEEWELILAENKYFLGQQPSSIDVACFPFIRQARNIFSGLWDGGFPSINQWLNYWLDHPSFVDVMRKHPIWCEKGED